MYYATLTLDLLLGDVRSLKEKRSIIRPIIAELDRRAAVGAAEVGYQDLYRRAEIGVVAVAGTAARAGEVLRDCEDAIARRPEVELLAARTRLHGADDE